MPSSPPSAERGQHLVLVGMMGSGKTTVGRIVASRLGRRFVDSDAQVEARTGRTVRDIFEADGEAAFRRFETDALREALAVAEPQVVAAAGGVVLAEENRELLRPHRVVWLDVDPAVLAARVRPGDHRPLIADEPAVTLARLDAQRRPLYEEVADVVVRPEGVTPAETADQVVAAVDR